MPPSPLTPTVRYVPPGTRKVYWVTTIATYTAPTRGELNAGIDLSPEVAAVNGFTVTSGTVPTPDLSSRFVSEIPGITAATAASVLARPRRPTCGRAPPHTVVRVQREGDVPTADGRVAREGVLAVGRNMKTRCRSTSSSITKIPANLVIP
jgi:hypothetical protein